jgi:hypothetical protein
MFSFIIQNSMFDIRYSAFAATLLRAALSAST